MCVGGGGGGGEERASGTGVLACDVGTLPRPSKSLFWRRFRQDFLADAPAQGDAAAVDADNDETPVVL